MIESFYEPDKEELSPYQRITAGIRWFGHRIAVALPVHEGQAIGGRLISIVNGDGLFRFPVKANLSANIGNGATYGSTLHTVIGLDAEKGVYVLRTTGGDIVKYDKYWVEKHFSYS